MSTTPHEAIVFGWRIVVGSVMGFFGASLGSIGGIGGGGIFITMLTLIIGLDAKSAAPISKCMMTGAAASTVYYNLKRRHPTIDMPVVDFNLALLIQPMLMLGISIGVALRTTFAEWMLTILLIIVFMGPLTMAFFKGIETWKKETIMKKEAVKCLEYGTDCEEGEHKSAPSSPSCGTQKKTNSVIPVLENECTGREELDNNSLPSLPTNGTQKKTNASGIQEVPILENVYWKELGVLVLVWVAFLVLQIAKNETATCSIAYWVVSSMQIPVTVGGTLYQAVSLYKGKKVIMSMGEAGVKFNVHQLILYCSIGLLAGMVGELLRLGAGFILVPLFLELGIPPQVSSATGTFLQAFSASMSAIEYYLLKPFPVPYALYFLALSAIAAFVGQHAGRLITIIFRRSSLIIFILVFTIFMSSILLGGIGIANMIKKIERNEYMGFEKLCQYDA